MPVMPGVIWKGDQSGKRRMDRYDVFCAHTIVGYAPAEAAHFSVFADGDIQQSRDTIYQSAANLDGNHRVIASENEDRGSLFNGMPRTRAGIPPMTNAQIEANAEIFKWLNDEHGIPLQMCPNSKPSSRGLAYHRQGIDGNFSGYRFPGRVQGGEIWTEHFGKVCPDDLRIAQLPDILRLAKEEIDMPLNAADKQWLEKMMERKVRDALNQEDVLDRVDEARVENPDATAKTGPKAMSLGVLLWGLNSKVDTLVREIRSK